MRFKTSYGTLSGVIGTQAFGLTTDMINSSLVQEIFNEFFEKGIEFTSPNKNKIKTSNGIGIIASVKGFTMRAAGDGEMLSNIFHLMTRISNV